MLRTLTLKEFKKVYRALRKQVISPPLELKRLNLEAQGLRSTRSCEHSDSEAFCFLVKVTVDYVRLRKSWWEDISIPL